MKTGAESIGDEQIAQEKESVNSETGRPKSSSQREKNKNEEEWRSLGNFGTPLR